MLSIEVLKEYGADPEQGLKRCMGKEDFYFKLINMALKDANFAKLEEAFNAADYKACFEAAHAIKGVVGNLSLTPLYNAASDLTELLRPQEPCDCEAQVKAVLDGLAELKKLVEE